MLISVGIFVTVTLAVLASSYLVGRWYFPDGWEVRRRLAREFQETDENLPATPLFKSPDQLNLERPNMEGSETTMALRAPVVRASWRESLANLLEQGQLSWTVSQLLTVAFSSGLLVGIAAYCLSNLIVGILGAIAGLLMPFMYAQWRRRQRQETFLRQLPSAFELMAQVIRAGQSVPQALQAVVDAFENPLSGEFAQCQAHLGLGLRPEVTFREMAQRSGLMEMRIFVMSLLIQQQTGGNLSEVLDRLGAMVRARLKLRNQVRTLTAEGRLQGWTLVVLPFVVFAAMMVVNRQYAETLLENVSLLVFLGIAMLAGILWIRRIVNFEY